MKWNKVTFEVAVSTFSFEASHSRFGSIQYIKGSWYLSLNDGSFEIIDDYVCPHTIIDWLNENDAVLI